MGRKRKELAMTAPPLTDDAQAVEQDIAPESVIVAEYHEELPSTQPIKWLVLEDAVVSLFGQMTTLPAGTVVSASSYGPDGVKRIIEQGVMLEPVG